VDFEDENEDEEEEERHAAFTMLYSNTDGTDHFQ
jgi:hypothetical protein